MLKNCQNLEELWKIVDDLNIKYFPKHHLMPILGNGKTASPRFMFVFINPTYANISSKKDWQGPRFPFIGTKPVWRIFYRAGMFDGKLMHTIEKSKIWSLEFTNKVLKYLKKKAFYFTNVVKWTGSTAALPDFRKIKLFLPILVREIQIVKPKYIVTFGLIPFENLARQKIKLGKYYKEVIKNKKLKLYNVKFGNFRTKIIPCYFPVGRGNPRKAVEILKLINKL